MCGVPLELSKIILPTLNLSLALPLISLIVGKFSNTLNGELLLMIISQLNSCLTFLVDE